MNLKLNRLLMFCLIVTSIVLNACGAEQKQPVASQTSPSVGNTFTPMPANSTVTATLMPTLTETLLPTMTATFLYPLPTFSTNCGTVKIGQAGTQIIDNSENLLIQGIAILCGQIYFSPGDLPKTISVVEGMIDLDTGTIDSTSADIEFCPGAGSMIFYYFCDINDTLVKEFSLLPQDPEQPTFEDCQNVMEHYSRTNDNEPKYACVITNSGNISRVKIERYNPLDDEMSLEISFITWKK